MVREQQEKMLNPTFRHISRCPIWAPYIDHTWVSSLDIFCYLILHKTEERFFLAWPGTKLLAPLVFSVNRWFLKRHKQRGD